MTKESLRLWLPTVLASSASPEEVLERIGRELPSARTLECARDAFQQIKKLAPGPANWQDIEWIADKALEHLDALDSAVPMERAEEMGA